MYSHETELLAGFSSWFCRRCEPASRERLEKALREFTPVSRHAKEQFRQLSVEIEEKFAEAGPPRPPVMAGEGCANCGSALGDAPLWISSHTAIGWCVKCLLAGLDGSPRIDPERLAATATARRKDLDRGRQAEMTVRQAEARPFNPVAYARAVKAASETSATGLVYEGKLWELVRRCKLAKEPRVPVTVQELNAGFSSNNFLQGTEEELNEIRLKAIREMLPHIEALPSDDPSQSYEKEELHGWIVSFAYSLRKLLDDDAKARLLRLIDAWKPRSAYPEGRWETVVQKVGNHMLIRANEVAYVRHLLKEPSRAANGSRIEYVRNAQLDADQLIDLWRRAALPNLPNREAASLMVRHGSVVILARSNGMVVGALRALTDHVSVCLICEVIVDKNFRQSGVGKRLVTELREAVGHSVPLSAVSKEEPTFLSHIGFQPAAGLQLGSA